MKALNTRMQRSSGLRSVHMEVPQAFREIDLRSSPGKLFAQVLVSPSRQLHSPRMVIIASAKHDTREFWRWSSNLIYFWTMKKLNFCRQFLQKPFYFHFCANHFLLLFIVTIKSVFYSHYFNIFCCDNFGSSIH